MKVLIADDERISRGMLAETVRRLGHEVVVASDGREALERLEDEGIELAILDWTMPELDGIDVCAKVRSQKRTSYLYLILVSARTKPESVIEGLEAGADDYVAKPFSTVEILARVRAAERVLRYQAEAAVYRAYLDEIIANLDCGVLLSHPSGRILFANEALARHANVPSAHVVGRFREEVLAVHSCEASDDASGTDFLRAMTRADADVKIELELATPELRVVEWTSKVVHLGAMEARLDLARDVTAEVALASKLEEQATHDHLTGLLNRRGGEEATRREVARATRHGAPVSFLSADIDHFKSVNDRFGHATGDRVLAAVAACVRNNVRTYDYAVRWGGEEILVVLPETSGFEAALVAERIRTAVERLVVPEGPAVTISIGFAELGAAGLDAALSTADEALYSAKQAGRNCSRRVGDERATMVPPREHSLTPKIAYSTRPS